MVPRHPWTLGDNAPTKRLDSGLALIHVQRDHRETVPILEPQVRRSCQRSCRGHRVGAFRPKSSAATARLISKSETRPCAAWGTALQCMPRTASARRMSKPIPRLRPPRHRCCFFSYRTRFRSRGSRRRGFCPVWTACATHSCDTTRSPEKCGARQQAAGTDRAWALGRGVSA